MNQLEYQKQDFMMHIFSDVNQVNVKLVYVDMADGDINAGILLSQIVYWNLPSRETGKTKLRVKKDGHLWLAKRRTDWYEETRLTDKKYDRAIKILEKNKLVEVKNYMFKHKGSDMPSKTPHIRILWDTFLLQYRAILNESLQKAQENEGYPQEENEVIPNETGDQPYSDMDFTERGKSVLPKGEDRFYPNGKIGFTERVTTITENTNKEYITENTDIDHHVSNPLRSDIPIDSNITKLLEEEGQAKKIVFQNEFSKEEIQEAFRFVEPQMINETVRELTSEYNISNHYIARILCYMKMAGLKFVSTSEIVTKLREIEMNNRLDRKGRPIGDESMYVVQGIVLSRRSRKGDNVAYIKEKMKKDKKKKDADKQERSIKRSERAVPFYNWLEQ